MNRTIELFVAAYEERSFTLAAAREGATQSGISQHIRKLEERFGVALFERRSGKVIPTPAADRYYRRCVDILRLDALAQAELRQFGSETIGTLSVGLMPTLSARVLAPALIEFQQLYPNMRLNIIEAFSGPLTDVAQRGDIDFAIVPQFSGAKGLRMRSFGTSPEVLIAGPELKLPRRGMISLHELPSLRLILPHPENTRSQTILRTIAANGLTLDDSINLDTMLGTIDLVSRSGWSAIVPALLIEGLGEHRGLSMLQLKDPALNLELVIVEPARRVIPKAGEAFIEVIRNKTAEALVRWEEQMSGLRQ